MRSLIGLLAVGVLGVACDIDRASLAPDVATQRAPNPAELTVMSYNVYYGVDLDVLLEESMPLPVRTALVLAQLQSTNAPERAVAIARQIAAARPHLVGLQEVARWRLQSPGDFLDANFNVQNPFPNAEDEIFDFLDLLLAALAAHGADYVVASRTTTLDAELPVLHNGASCTPCDDLRFTESVAILARADVPVGNPQNQLFAVNLPVTVSGMQVELVKGWAAVDAVVNGRTYRFATTHLEPADRGPNHSIIEPLHQIQQAQAAQLLGALAASPYPVVLTGDLNSEPGTSTSTYPLMLQAGFVDTWLVGAPRGDGFTANQDADLRNAESALWHRIDYVLYRDDFTMAGGPFRGSVDARVVGARQQDRTPSGLWPSDHAAVLATLRLGQPH